MTLTDDYTYQFTDDGVILNSDVYSMAPFVDITKVSGLDTSEYRTSERVREGSDGGFIDSQFENMRAITLEGTIYCPTDQAEIFSDTLKGNFAPSFGSQPFYFKHPSVAQRVIFAKSLGCRYDVNNLRRVGKTDVQFQLKAEDPSIYGNEISVVVGQASPPSGRGYNKSYNYGYGTTSGTAGVIDAYNEGNKPTPAIIRLQNIINPEIVNDTVGKRLKFTATIDNLDYYNIDLRNRTVILNGTANRRGTVIGTSQWFLLQPGSNRLRLLGSPGSMVPTMYITYRPAWR